MFMSLQRVNLSYYRRAGPIKSLADKKVFRLTKWTTSYFIIVLMRILPISLPWTTAYLSSINPCQVEAV